MNGHSRPWDRWMVPAVVVLGLSASALMAWQWRNHNERQIQEATRTEAERVVNTSIAQLERAALGLRGARGYLLGAGPDDTTAQGFRSYFETRDLAREFPGVMGVGVIRRVAETHVEAFIASVRSHGLPDFDIRVLAAHGGERRPIQYVEPVETNRAAIGLDVASEAMRRQATDLALTTDEPVLTGPIRLVQSRPGSSLGLLMVMRFSPSLSSSTFGIAEGASGYVYSPIQLDDLLNPQGLHQGLVHFDLEDVTPGDPPTDYGLSHGVAGEHALPVILQIERQVMGRVWRFAVRPTAGLVAAQHQIDPRDIFLAGAALTALLALLVRLRQNLRERTRSALAERIRLGTLLDHASDAIVGLDLQGHVQLWNQAATRLFGHSRDAAIRADLSSLVGTPATEEEHRQQLAIAARGDTSYPLETVRRRADSELVDVEISSSPILDEQGAIVGVAQVFHPIQERLEQIRHLRAYGEELEKLVAQRTRALEEVSRDLRQVLDGVPALIGAGDAQGKVRYANRALAALADSTPEAMIGRPWNAVLPRSVRDRLQAMVDGALRGEVGRAECQVVTAGHPTERHLDWSAVPGRDDAGRVSGFFLLASDVTAIQQAQQLLAASEARFRRIYRATPAMLHTIDPQGSLLEVSDFWLQKLGYLREEVIGRRSTDFLLPECLPSARENLQHLFQTGRLDPVPLKMVAKDGHVLDISLNAIIENDAAGQPTLVLATIEDVTERLLAEAALRAEQQRLENILLGTGAGTWEWNVATGETRFNERWANIIGWTLDELAPVSITTWSTHAHPDDLERSNEALQRHFEGESDLYDCEVRMRHQDGRWIWVHDRGRLLSRLPNGDPEWMFGTHMDITARKEAEQVRAEQHAAMQAILDAAPVAVRIASARDHRVLMINEEYTHLLQRPAEEAFGLDVSRYYVHPQDFESVVEALGRGEIVHNRLVELHRPHLPESPHVWALCSYMLVHYQGEACSLAWIYDVTPLRDAQEAARQSQEVQAQALEATLAGLVIFGADDRLEVINQRMLDMYPNAADHLRPGVTFEEFSRVITALYRGPNDPLTDHWVQERLSSFRRGGTWMRKLVDGRTVRVVERELSDGKFVSLRTDVTELVRAQEAAEAASRAKSEFLASTSHEIRTPLNAILGLTYLLEHETLPAPAREQLRRISQAGRSLLALVNDVLDLSKIESGQIWLDVQDFDLRKLVDDELTLLSNGLSNPEIEVGLDFDFRVPNMVHGDATRLRQILNNLIGNALKFTHQGSVRVAVRPGSLPVMIDFEVRDTGIGIEPDVQERLFRPFEQADASITKRYGGTGLGLSITSRLVGLMGGTIRLDSQPGLGTTFTVSLPLTAVQAGGNELPLPQADTHRILLMATDPSRHAPLKATLERLGWPCRLVTVVADMAETMRSASGGSHPFQVLLIDRGPAQRSALDALPTLKADLGNDTWPIVVALTDGQTEFLPTEASATLVDTQLIWPNSPSSVFDLITFALAARESARAPDRQKSQEPAVPIAWLHGLHLLVVDDSALNLEVARKVLELDGADVAIADNGPSALAALESAATPFDAVLLDVMMPGMDGIEVVRRIRSMDRFRDLPVVALTAGVLREQREDALRAGMTDFLPKPLEPNKVITCLRRHIARRRGGELPLVPRAVREEVAPMAPMPPIEGLDMHAVALPLQRDRALLLTMIRRLVTEFEDLPRGDRSTLGARLHKLKGSALTIGARALAHTVMQAEALQGTEDREPELQGLLEQLSSQLAALSQWVDDHADKFGTGKGTPPSVAPTSDETPLPDDQFELLRRLVGENSTRALNRVHHQQGALVARIGQARVDALRTALQLFDFDTAQQVLDGNEGEHAV